MATRSLEGRRLIDEHHGNVIAHRIAKPARVAKETRLLLTVFELAFALRADENAEQLR
jgi:hypothetical protein